MSLWTKDCTWSLAAVSEVPLRFGDGVCWQTILFHRNSNEGKVHRQNIALLQLAMTGRCSLSDWHQRQ